ncbi:DUF3344 domain-containing protein [Methanobrevibacter sp.]|uniref:DUF3344 domain-containing protein n=1 Tax=Methanobrevibacter sp. TaxID=66852 RepID=UPI00386BA82B
MKTKLFIISALIAFILFSGFVFAEDTASDEMINMEIPAEECINLEDVNDDTLTQNEEPIYKASGDGTFTELNNTIKDNNVINLSKNYTSTKVESLKTFKNGITIDKNITINGNNFTIDGAGVLTLFTIKSNSRVILNDVVLTNTFKEDSTMITNQGELIFNNVTFTSDRSISKAGSGNFRDIYNTGSLTINNSNFINSKFEITVTDATKVQNINVRGFIDNEGELTITNTNFNNNYFTPTNGIGRVHEISTILFNNASDTTVTLNNISVVNNTVQYSSSAQEVFRGFIRSESGNLIITNSLFENNTALFPNSNSQCLGILLANGNDTLINNTLFKTNEFKDSIITTSANNLVIMRSVFDSNSLERNIIQNKGSGQLKVTHNLFLNNALPSSTTSRLIDSSSNNLNISENYWGTNEPNFKDISSTRDASDYIILTVDGPTQIFEQENIYTITLNQLNTTEKLEDNALYDYYIEMKSNNLGTTTPVEIKNGIGYYTYIPIDNGEDVLTIGDIKLKVNVTRIFLSATVDIITEYKDTVYAGTQNLITTKIFVNKDFGEYVIKFFADGVEINETVQNLTRSPKEIKFLDSTIRPIDESTMAGANNKKINYTINVYKEDALIGNTTVILPLLYNGYFGKDCGYPINDVGFDYAAVITGDIMIQLQDGNTYIEASTTQKEYEWRTVLSPTSQFTQGLLYIPYNWDKTTTGTYPEFDLIFNNQNINSKIVGKYQDQSNLGTYGTYRYGVLIYNITDCLQNGRNTLKLEKENGLTAVYPPTLITMYNTTNSDTLKTIYIKNGADLLYNEYNLLNRPIQTDATIVITNVENITKATLYVFAAGAGVDEADLEFNNRTYTNIWENSTGTNYNGMFIADVTDIAEKTNNVTFISTGGTILALQNILVTEHPIIREKTLINLSTEYKNTAYAGTNNTITADIKINEEGIYDIRLLANGEEVANITQNLTKEWMKLLLTDQTVRPIDETSVSGANNQQINYTLEICQNGNPVANSSIVVPLLYNGYLGKDYAYPNSNLEFNYQNTITGDIIIQIQADDTYLGLSNESRIDNWEIILPENSNIINSFLYISYNWDKTTSSDYPDLTLTFNGRNIKDNLVGRYKDQSNLGTSGKYGYGLLIYDVSDLLFNGQNSLTLKKASGLTSIYPSALITIYNTTESNTLKNIIISNNADLLYNSYNVANRSVQHNNLIELEPLEKTTLYVFAASANNGDADLKINNNTYSNIWKDYESTSHNGVFEIDVTDIIETNNTINFIATRGTVLALQQIIVTEKTVDNQSTAPENNTEDNSTNTTNSTAGNNNTSGNSNTNTANNSVKKTTTTKKKKTAPKLTAKKRTYKAKTKKKKITAILKNKNKKGIRGAKIVFKIKGKKYISKTNKKGIATVKVKIKKKGRYTVKITFYGSKLYTAKTIKTKLIIK